MTIKVHDGLRKFFANLHDSYDRDITGLAEMMGLSEERLIEHMDDLGRALQEGIAIK